MTTIYIIYIALVVIVWLACGVWGTGYLVRERQCEFPGRACRDLRYDQAHQILLLLGPIILWLALRERNPKYGWGFNHVCPDPSRHEERRKGNI